MTIDNMPFFFFFLKFWNQRKTQWKEEKQAKTNKTKNIKTAKPESENMPTLQLSPGEITERHWKPLQLVWQTQLFLHNSVSEHHWCHISVTTVWLRSAATPSSSQPNYNRKKSSVESVGLVWQLLLLKLWMDGLKSERDSVGGSLRNKTQKANSQSEVSWRGCGQVTDHLRWRWSPASTSFLKLKFEVERQPGEQIIQKNMLALVENFCF